jgi:hypothetical protein
MRKVTTGVAEAAIMSVTYEGNGYLLNCRSIVVAWLILTDITCIQSTSPAMVTITLNLSTMLQWTTESLLLKY